MLMKITMTAAFCAFCAGTLAIADTVAQLNRSSLGQTLVQHAIVTGVPEAAPLPEMVDKDAPSPAAPDPAADAKTVSVTPHKGDA